MTPCYGAMCEIYDDEARGGSCQLGRSRVREARSQLQGAKPEGTHTLRYIESYSQSHPRHDHITDRSEDRLEIGARDGKVEVGDKELARLDASRVAEAVHGLGRSRAQDGIALGFLVHATVCVCVCVCVCVSDGALVYAQREVPLEDRTNHKISMTNTPLPFHTGTNQGETNIGRPLMGDRSRVNAATTASCRSEHTVRH